MSWLSSWPRAAKVIAALSIVLALVGWGLALQRGGQLDDTARQLSEAEQANQSQAQRTQELEATIAREREAAGDLAAITQQRDSTRAELSQAEEALRGAEQRSQELTTGIAAAEQRSQELATAVATAEQRMAELQQQGQTSGRAPTRAARRGHGGRSQPEGAAG